MSTFIKKSLKSKKPFSKRKKINWSQSLRSLREKDKALKKTKVRKSLRYLLLLKKYKYIIDHTNPTLLKAFLTKSAKIKSRRKTRIRLWQQRKVGKAIRRARALGLLPYVSLVKF